MANPAPTINQINAFNATQGTTIDFNIIGGTELVRSNRIYIYDLSDNSLICTHLYVSTESIHELPANTDGSIVYESGKSSADFVNGAQYYAQIQTFTDIAGTEGGSGLSVAKMFWCLVDPTLTITTIPSTISTTSYNVSATYDANTSVVSNIIQQYQFSLYSATGSLLQSSGVVVGSGTQQGTSTAYDISYNFTGLSVGSSYYVVVDVTTTQGMSVSVQSNTFTVSIDTPTLGEATVVNNACDGYISVTSNLSSEYGGSGSGEIVSFETDSENVFTKLQVDLDPIQDLHGYDKPWVGGGGKNKLCTRGTTTTINDVTFTVNADGSIKVKGTASANARFNISHQVDTLPSGTYTLSGGYSNDVYITLLDKNGAFPISGGIIDYGSGKTFTLTSDLVQYSCRLMVLSGTAVDTTIYPMIESGSSATTWTPYSNICPISGHDEVGVVVVGKNLFDPSQSEQGYIDDADGVLKGISSVSMRSTGWIPVVSGETYFITSPQPTGQWGAWYDANKTYISGFTNYSTAKTAPSDAKYLRVTVNSGGTNPDYATNVMIAKGNATSAYEPYTAETIHQDIEATYTPTVQENEPYQFKRTGDVGGDRESIELVGGSVAWNQRISIRATSRSATNNGVTFTDNRDGSYTFYTDSNGATANSSFIIDQDTSPTAILSGHKYYFAGFGSTNQNIYRLADQYNGVLQYRIGADSGVSVASANGRLDLRVVVTNGAVITTPITVKPILVDLTLALGSTIADYIYTLEQGQAGAGVAFFRKYFPKPYYPYDAGTIKSVEGVSAHKTVGFNQFDKSTVAQGHYIDNDGSDHTYGILSHTDYIKAVPNTIYYISDNQASANVKLCACYDSNKNFIEFAPAVDGNGKLRETLPNTAYIIVNMLTSVIDTLCINLSWDGERNGEYEPYVEHSYPLDSSLTLRGIPKIANGKLYYDGDTYTADGTVTRKYGKITFDGTEDWKASPNANRYYVDLTDATFPYSRDWSAIALSSIFPFYQVSTSSTYLPDKQFMLWRSSDGSSPLREIIFHDSAVADVSAWKAKLTATPITVIYPLATPTTEQAEPFESIQKVTPNYGTEEFVTTTNVPVGNNTQYLTRDIYGGHIDLVSGLLVLDKAYYNVGKYNEWNTWGVNAYTQGITGFYLYPNSIYSQETFENLRQISNCNMLPITNLSWGGQAVGAWYNMNASQQSNWYYMFSVPNETVGIVDGDSNATAITKWNAFLENNPIQIVHELATPLTYQLTPQQIQTLVGVNNVWSEQGDIELSYHIPITNLLVKRQDVGDVSGSWLTLYSQPITQASDMDFTFIDFTNQYGKTYKYALVPLLTQTQSGVEVEVEGGYTVSDEVQSVFDGVFIADSTGSQKCKANVGYGNVDMNQAVGTITPIGAKYPVVITNSQNQYHNGSISGTIVPDDYYFNGNLSRIDMVNKRDELEQFLTNKRAKIIKDWNGKIWLVMIMDNVSCTFNNNYGMGIVNFSTNWVEVGDPTNQEDLQATGLINIGGV